MKPIISFCLLALLVPINSHAQKQIEKFIAEMESQRPNTIIRTIVKRNAETLKIESEQKFLQFTDKEMAAKLKLFFKEESEHAVYFEQSKSDNSEAQTLQFVPTDGIVCKYFLNIQPNTSQVTLNVSKSATH